MQKLKSEKGITIIALVITIVVLMLISAPIIVNSSGVIELAKYSKFKDDIDNLRESISIAFNSENLSAIGPNYEGQLDFLDLEQNGKKVKSDNDNDTYYVINVNEVNKRLPTGMKELNYGNENSKIGDGNIYFGTSDVYIINDASRTIYYVKGITYNGNTFYRLPEDLSSTEYGIKPGEIVTDFNKYFTDKEGNTAKIPVGFKVSDKEEEQIVSKGLVISNEQGNEFVWIPTSSFKMENGNLIDIEFDRYIYGNQVDGGIDNVYQSTRIYNDEENKNLFYESDKEFETLSVSQNGGFYIARYEAGSSAVRTDSSTNDAPVVKKGVNVYNYIKRNDAKTLAENFINTNDVSSKLCSSQAWDTALQFLKQTGNDSYLTDSSLGNYNGTLKTTGSSTSVNNIFDLGGNANEWTTELYSDDSMQFTVRGGSVENTSSASPAPSRIATGDIKSANTGFRITLFLSANTSSVPLDKIDIGDVVNYTPSTDKSSFSLTTAMSGYTSNQDIKRENYTWKVLSKNSDGSVDIMGVPTAEMQAVYFRGPTGYNNGVYYLNEICNQLYSNNALGVTARSINIEDIESKMNDAGIVARNAYVERGSNTKYGATKDYSGNNIWYPNLARYENTLGIDGGGLNTERIGESDDGTGLTDKGITIPLLEEDISSYESSKTKASSKITVKQNHYYFNSPSTYFDNQKFYNLIFGTGTYYWLASRISVCVASYANFGLRCVGGTGLTGVNLFYSNVNTDDGNHRMAPVVHLGNDIKWSQKEDGSWNLSSGSAAKGTAGDLSRRLAQGNNSVVGKKVNISNLNLPSIAKAKDYEWQILYADNNHIYLIASNCIKIDDCPATEKGINMNKYSNYVYNGHFTNIVAGDDYTRLSSVNSKVRDLNKDFFDKYINESTINENMKAVLYLLDTKIWEKKFVGENNSKVYFVVGSPSIELLFKAHNAYYGTTLSAKAFSSVGYKISTKESNQENDYSVTSDLLQTNNSAIVLSENDISGHAKNADAIWLASPGTRQNTDSIMRLLYYGNINSDDVRGHDEGFRPIICLNYEVQLEENSDRSFSIK